MPWYAAYLEKQDIVDWAVDQRPDLTTGDITDSVTRMADTLLFACLTAHNISVDYTGTVSGNQASPTDINNFLWAASLAYNLEVLSMRGVINYSHGGLQATKFGKVADRKSVV